MNEYQYIRTEHGKNRVLGAAVEIDGKKALAFMKNGKVEGYIFFDDLCRRMYSLPFKIKHRQ